jgi:hypothetical protein
MNKQHYKHVEMAPSTRSTVRDTTPDRPIDLCERSTRKRIRFFEAYDSRSSHESMSSIAALKGINKSTASRWLQQRALFGSLAERRTRRLSQKVGSQSKVSKEICQILISPSRNPVRNQAYEAQIEYHNIKVQPRQLRRMLQRYTNQARRYKCAYIQKKISLANRQKRYKYGQDHQGKTIDNFWQYVFFSDEAHIDPSSSIQGRVLREQGTRYNSSNIQERGEKKGVALHIAAWVNWHGKAEKLEFYHDEEDSIIKPKRPPKPRKSKYQSEEEYQARLETWEADLGHEKEVRPKGNAMTQKYYCERLLPVYIKAIHTARLQDSQSWLFQED